MTRAAQPASIADAINSAIKLLLQSKSGAIGVGWALDDLRAALPRAEAADALAEAAEKAVYRPPVDDSRQIDQDMRALRAALRRYRAAEMTAQLPAAPEGGQP